MKNKFGVLLLSLLVILFLFVSVVSFNLKFTTDTIMEAKLIVSKFMYNPDAVMFKNINMYKSNKVNHERIINICGEVFSFKDYLPYKYKRFIIKSFKDNNGKDFFSFPLFDFEGEMISEKKFQQIWDDRCKPESL